MLLFIHFFLFVQPVLTRLGIQRNDRTTMCEAALDTREQERGRGRRGRGEGGREGGKQGGVGGKEQIILGGRGAHACNPPLRKQKQVGIWGQLGLYSKLQASVGYGAQSEALSQRRGGEGPRVFVNSIRIQRGGHAWPVRLGSWIWTRSVWRTWELCALLFSFENQTNKHHISAVFRNKLVEGGVADCPVLSTY